MNTVRHHAIACLSAIAAIVLGINMSCKRAYGAEVAGVTFADTDIAGTNRLSIVGAGLAKRYGFKVYAGAFYLQPGVTQADRFKAVPKKLVLEYLTSISAEAFAKTTENSMANALGEAELKSMRKNLDRLKKAFQDVVKGDRYALTYVPGAGMTLALNGGVKAAFRDEEFVNAVFGIWLGNKPIDERFKRAALGLK